MDKKKENPSVLWQADEAMDNVAILEALEIWKAVWVLTIRQIWTKQGLLYALVPACDHCYTVTVAFNCAQLQAMIGVKKISLASWFVGQIINEF